MIALDVGALLAKKNVGTLLTTQIPPIPFFGVTGVTGVTRLKNKDLTVTPGDQKRCNKCNTSNDVGKASQVLDNTSVPAPPPYPGHPVGRPFRPGQKVWLYRFDDHAPRFDVPVTIVQMRTLWAGEDDIGWRNAAGEVTWHNARLAVRVQPPC